MLAFISRFILIDALIIPSYPESEDSKQNEPIYWAGQNVCSGFSKILPKNLNELFGQPNTWARSYYGKW